jgi:hypothetical protein
MSSLEKFGKFIVENFRDRAIEQHMTMQAGRLRSPTIQKLQADLLALSVEQRKLVLQIVTDAVDVATHDILLAIQDAHDRHLGIEITVDGANVAKASGMLQGEPLGEKGWIERFSKYRNLLSPEGTTRE